MKSEIKADWRTAILTSLGATWPDIPVLAHSWCRGRNCMENSYQKTTLALFIKGLAATVLAFSCLSPAWAQGRPATGKPVALPRLGEVGGLDLSVERRLGDRIAAQLLQDPTVLEDPVLDGYLQQIWQPLIRTAQSQGSMEPEMGERFAWRLFLVKDRSVNAFALPGGYLGVHLGLVGVAASADELASVLAHELSHVAQRHISRMISRQDQQTPWMIAAMVLGAVAASQSKNADVLQAAVVGGQAVAVQSQLNFTRDMEREADRIGYSVMTGAGFDGVGFVSLFDKLQQSSRLNDDGSFPYLRSHPLTTERMADMAGRHGHDRANNAAGSAAQVPALVHALMAARARVLAEPDSRRLHALLQSADKPVAGLDVAQHRLATAYTQALAASRLNDHVAAVAKVRQLLDVPAQPPELRAMLLALALEVGRAAGWPSGGPSKHQWIQLATEALAHPDRAAWWWGAAAGVELGQAARASDKLQPWVLEHPSDAAAWQVLARAWAAQNWPLRAVRAEAEARLAVLDLAGAVDRLQAGRELSRHAGHQTAGDHVDASVLDARWRELSQRLREQRMAEMQSNGR
jgi:beta-barrel assembly-enhancing protease